MMVEYIEREAFLASMRNLYCKDCVRRKGKKNGKLKTLYEIGEAPCRACGIDDVLSDVEDFPVSDVQPVVHGKWENKYNQFGDRVYPLPTCSVCGFCTHIRNNYCPDCGARMDGEDNA